MRAYQTDLQAHNKALTPADITADITAIRTAIFRAYKSHFSAIVITDIQSRQATHPVRQVSVGELHLSLSSSAHPQYTEQVRAYFLWS